jgi:methionine-rich copper-binding protein CopC
VTLWFSQRLEQHQQGAGIGPAGQVVDKGDSQLDPADAKQIGVTLPRLESGTYRVHWRVLSTDSHVNEGDFTFDVGP